jgi:hypothetical protein
MRHIRSTNYLLAVSVCVYQSVCLSVPPLPNFCWKSQEITLLRASPIPQILYAVLVISKRLMRSPGCLRYLFIHPNSFTTLHAELPTSVVIHITSDRPDNARKTTLA